MLPFSYRCGYNRMHRKCSRRIFTMQAFRNCVTVFCCVLLHYAIDYILLPHTAANCLELPDSAGIIFEGMFFRVLFRSCSGLVRVLFGKACRQVLKRIQS